MTEDHTDKVSLLKRAEAAEARVEEVLQLFESELITPLQTRWVEIQQALLTALWLMWEAKAEKRSLREDLNRISAEREAYREALQAACLDIEDLIPVVDEYLHDDTTKSAKKTLPYARRILAENDR